MKVLNVIVLFELMLVSFASGCGQLQPTGDVRIVLVDSFSARRTYPVTSLCDSAVDAAVGAYPVLTTPPFMAAALREKLELVGFLRGDSLVVSNFSEADTVYRGINDSVKLVLHQCMSGDCSELGLSVTLEGRTGSLSIPRQTGDRFRIALANISNGGQVEIILSRQWYIANGDNFDVYIYDIRF